MEVFFHDSQESDKVAAPFSFSPFHDGPDACLRPLLAVHAVPGDAFHGYTPRVFSILLRHSSLRDRISDSVSPWGEKAGIRAILLSPIAFPGDASGRPRSPRTAPLPSPAGAPRGR